MVDFPSVLAEAGTGGVEHWLVERDDQPAPLRTSRASFDYLAAVRF